ncbi:DUF3472 domain-containing protein [Amycolatopsis anabasis]|uniref:DUF3472 domain-containing protein n=1 Tax=Amycolatopsis anabasis TaxID=1840409 RepID=UPI00131BDB01|nr:DUF3472 domain-containing protein [Amycolatopsis anabasis]
MRILRRGAPACAAALLTLLCAAPAGAATGKTPGTYSDFALGSAAVSTVDFPIVIEQDPGQENVFWSNQFGFRDGEVGGYAGIQTHDNGRGLYLFSLWNSTAYRAGGSGTYCQKFSEDGSGYSCRAELRPAQGHRYRVRIADEGGGWFGATIFDDTAGSSVRLGSLQTGSGNALEPNGVSWVEYFDWNDPNATCEQAHYSRARWSAPIVNGGAHGSFTSTSVSPSCPAYSKVTLSGADAVHENGIPQS